MTNHSGTLTADQGFYYIYTSIFKKKLYIKLIDFKGAETPVYLALLPPNAEPRGKFVSQKKVFDWENDSVY